VGGFEYRKDSTDQVADAVAKIYTAAYPIGGWQFGNRPDIKGAITVKEYFAETIVPILKDMPLVRALDLNAAIRKTNYSTSGNVTTWKVGLTYAMPGGLLLRATKSKDIRAPNATELYQSLAAASVGNVVDFGRAGNPTYIVPASSVGNPLLKPESADSKTVGLTWEPPTIPGFHASVDLYDIYLKDNIAQLTAATVVASCYGGNGLPVNAANCAFITRDASGSINNVLSVFTNQSYQKNKGMDVELGYRFALSNVMSAAKGNLSLRVLGSYLDEFTTNNFITTIDSAGVLGTPHWRWTSNATYTNGPLQLFVQSRYVEPVVIAVPGTAALLASDVGINNLPSRTYWNASAQYQLWDNGTRGRLALFGNINNIFDRDPPAFPSGNAAIPSQASLAADFDKIGRAFTLGVRFSY
jgi:iron complex outermembrane recepter protein